MKLLLLILMGAAVVIVGASYLEFTSSGWAYSVCSLTFGLCDFPTWVAIGASMLFAMYMAYWSWL